jgi:hypothetical protein
VRTEALTRALGRLEDALLDAPVLEAVVARREAGVLREGDAEHARALADELCRYQLDDGSWAGSLVRTAESMILLRTLAPDAADKARRCADRAAHWIESRVGLPGAFGEGCDPARHEAGLCKHAIGGLYSPGGASENLTGLTLGVPARFGTDADARLGAAAIALLAVLRWDRTGEAVEAPVSALRRIVAGDALGSPRDGTVAGYIAAVGALVEAPAPNEETRDVVNAGLGRILGVQRADGSWPGADTFHVLDVLMRAHARGYGSAGVENAIHRAVEMLALLQRSDGSWGRETGPERMLVGWRALRHAVGGPRQRPAR